MSATYGMATNPLIGGPLSAMGRVNVAAIVLRHPSLGDTGVMHGPLQWLEPTPPASVQTHERMRLFAPVDVMPGQTGMEL